MADILITGATGFVGSHFVEALHRRGIGARALVRRTSDLAMLHRLGVDYVIGDMDDPAALRRAATGVGMVVHLAAATRALRPATFDEVNAAGTRRLLDAMESAGVRRLVYLSSLAAAGPAGAGQATGEGEPRPLTAYGRSKLAGERHALGRTTVDTLVLRAPAVYGPRDRDLLPFFRLAAWGLLPVLGSGERRVQVVHVADLADALVRAVGRPDATGVLHIAEPAVRTWREMLGVLAAAVGRRGVPVPVPDMAVRGAARVSEIAARAAGRPAIFDRDKALELLADGWVCETERARAVLDFEAAVTLEEGFRATAAWYRAQGWL